jgi:ABC-type bacteriocin/lantibiotic exporter with double-glycine peptidase domain
MRAVLIFLARVLSCFSVGTASGQEPSPQNNSFTCGLNAAYLMLNKTGHHVPYADLERDFEKQNPPDSLLAIKNVLEKHGCSTLGIRTDADYFVENKGLAVVYLQLSGFGPQSENHFSVLVELNRNSGAELLDPIFDVTHPTFLSWGTFSKAFQGFALVLK